LIEEGVDETRREKGDGLKPPTTTYEEFQRAADVENRFRTGTDDGHGCSTEFCEVGRDIEGYFTALKNKRKGRKGRMSSTSPSFLPSSP